MKKKILIFLLFAAMVISLPAGIMAENKEEDQMKRAILKVRNLTCGGCFTTINQSLESQEGYSGFGANFFRGLVGVDFLPPLTPERIVRVISDAGYPAFVESIEDITPKESFKYLQTARRSYSGCGGGRRGGSQGSCCSRSPCAESGADTGKIKNQKYGGSCCAAPSAVQ